MWIKKIDKNNLILSAILAFFITQAKRMWFTGDVFGSIAENYMESVDVSTVLLFFLSLVICYEINEYVYQHVFLKLFNIKKLSIRLSTKKRLLITGALLFVVWILYYLSYYPGGLFVDTIVSINWYQADIWDNHYPILYTFLVGKTIDFGDFLGKDMTWSIGLFFALQMIVLGIEILFLLYWEIKRNIDDRIQLISMVLLIICPIVPLYGVSIWKDTPFCMALLFWMMPFVDLCLELKAGEWKNKTVILNIIGMYLMAFTRNNGFYAIGFAIMILFFVTIKKKVKKKLLFYSIGIVTLASIFIIQNPIYEAVGVQLAPRSDGLCVPLQQICAVVAHDGNISEKQWEEINILAPKKNIKENFVPSDADSIRWYSDIDGVYFGSKDFALLWLGLMKNNFGIYVDEYLLLTAGFWNTDIKSDVAFVNTYSWDQNLAKERDIFKELTGISFKDFSNPKKRVNCAWCFWLFFISMFYVIRRFGWYNCVYYSPAIGVWVTVMIATFIASSFRLVAPLVFILPFLFIIPNILYDRESKTEEEQ